MKEVYNENYESLKKEIEEDMRWWTDLLCWWIGRINIMEMAIQPKASICSKWATLKFQWHSSQRLKTQPCSSYGSMKRPWIAKVILSKKSNAGGIGVSIVKLRHSFCSIFYLWSFNKYLLVCDMGTSQF
jgi:hypothetical protein